tara:strand:- start:726 stop:1145 length:420 start_codon:yes stop_codon:yes gene_type:complete
MGIVGIAKRGFGKALKKYKQSKMRSGTSTRADRLKYGERGPTITGVKPAVKVPGASKEAIESSRQHGHVKVWTQRTKIASDLDKKVKAGKAAIKKRAHLGQTKVLKRQSDWSSKKYDADPSTGAKGTQPWSPPIKKGKK